MSTWFVLSLRRRTREQVKQQIDLLHGTLSSTVTKYCKKTGKTSLRDMRNRTIPNPIQYINIQRSSLPVTKFVLLSSHLFSDTLHSSLLNNAGHPIRARASERAGAPQRTLNTPLPNKVLHYNKYHHQEKAKRTSRVVMLDIRCCRCRVRRCCGSCCCCFLSCSSFGEFAYIGGVPVVRWYIVVWLSILRTVRRIESEAPRYNLNGLSRS